MCSHLAPRVTGDPTASRTPGKHLNREVCSPGISPSATASDCARSLRECSPGTGAPRAQCQASQGPKTGQDRATPLLVQPAPETPAVRALRHPPSVRGPCAHVALTRARRSAQRWLRRGEVQQPCPRPARHDSPAGRRLPSAPLGGPRDLDLWRQRQVSTFPPRDLAAAGLPSILKEAGTPRVEP